MRERNISKEMLDRQRERLIGKRIRLVFTNDEYTDLRAGDEGTVTFIDDTGTVFADWDNGSGLGLIEQYGDRFEVLTESVARG